MHGHPKFPFTQPDAVVSRAFVEEVTPVELLAVVEADVPVPVAVDVAPVGVVVVGGAVVVVVGAAVVVVVVGGAVVVVVVVGAR